MFNEYYYLSGDIKQKLKERTDYKFNEEQKEILKRMAGEFERLMCEKE